jgi:malonate-semialdehyde dehydrogenase (acetylating)/methylmalonate-semialdehyde dehydrogenase
VEADLALLASEHPLQVSDVAWAVEGVTDGRYQALIRQYQSEIAANITLEQGKTHADAMGDVFRGLQVVDTLTAIPTLLKGEHVEVAKDMDTYSIRNPLGVTAAICPFNFPAMSE